MSALQERLATLTRRTEREIRALWERHLGGEISEARFVALGGALLTRARQQGASLADVGLAMTLTRKTRRVVSPLGLTLPTDDQIATRKSIGTVLGAVVETVSTPEELAESRALRLGRLGRDAPADAHSWGTRVGMKERQIEKWVRETGGSACPLCQEWDDGVPRPVTTVMARHATCSCIQVPIVA